MITNLTIHRFKSIKALNVQCRKVNLFIGAPDTGKTNILEALALLSNLGWARPVHESLRLTSDLGFEPLFYRQFLDQPIEINTDKFGVSGAIQGQERHLLITHPNGANLCPFSNVLHLPQLRWVRYYSYSSPQSWAYRTDMPESDKSVSPPGGWNLLYIARHNEKVYNFLKDTIAPLNWRLKFDQPLKRFLLSDVRKDEIIDYNLDSISDTLKRLFFYGTILITSHDATLVMDEPDVYAFPPYPKSLGEMIAGDASNQFFLTTHNPYFLTGIVQKTPQKDLAIFVCHRDEEEGTKARLLEQDDVQKLIEQGASVFFNLEDFVKA